MGEGHDIQRVVLASSKKSKYTRLPCSSRTRKSPFSKPAEMVAMFMGETTGVSAGEGSSLLVLMISLSC